MRKSILFIVFVTLSLAAYGQYKPIPINRLKEVVGTDYVIASVETFGKMFRIKNSSLLFINTRNGEKTQIDLPDDTDMRSIKQIKIDSLSINLIAFTGKTVDVDGKRGIGLGDPIQIIALSPDGKQKTQLTEDNFFVKDWVVNESTGTIIVVGNQKTKESKKSDDNDKDEIRIYDLKTLKPIAEI